MSKNQGAAVRPRPSRTKGLAWGELLFSDERQHLAHRAFSSDSSSPDYFEILAGQTTPELGSWSPQSRTFASWALHQLSASRVLWTRECTDLLS